MESNVTPNITRSLDYFSTVQLIIAGGRLGMNTSQSWKIMPNCRRKQYKQQKIIVRKLIKKSKRQHYHEALNNARKNPKDT